MAPTGTSSAANALPAWRNAMRMNCSSSSGSVSIFIKNDVHTVGGGRISRKGRFEMTKQLKCSWLELLKKTYSAWSDDRGLRFAAALAYYAVFSIAPLLII